MPASHRARTRGASLASCLLAGLALAAPAGADVAPGRALEIDTSIELGLVDGYPSGSDVRVDVLRGATLIATKTVPGGGAVDVNHVGGGDCWGGVPAGRSPDVKGGDKMVATVLDAGGNPTADVDFMFLRDIAFSEATPNVITGTAFGVPGGGGFALTTPMAGETMDIQRRTDFRFGAMITVGGDGSFTTGLDGPANQGEVFINHVDGAGGGTSTTTVEPDGNGASACGERVTTALTSASHSVINAATVGTDLVVGGPRTAPTTVDGVAFGGKTYTPANNADTWSLTIPAADLAALADNADHTLRATLSDGSPDEVRVLHKDVTAPVVSTSVAPGAYTSAQRVVLTSDGGEQVRVTLDGSAPHAGSRAYDGLPIGLDTGRHTLRATATDAAGNATETTFAYTIAPGAVTPQVLVTPARPQGLGLSPAARALKVSALKAARRLRASAARRNGLRLRMSLARGTRVVQVSVFRKTGGRRKLVARVMRFPDRGGAYRVTLRGAKLRRALKPGLYSVEAVPGTSETKLDAAGRAIASVRVTR